MMGGMDSAAEWIKHVELYVNSSSTPAQQAESVDAIAILLKNDMLTLETLVKEMEMYLTTTDTIIRSRGILILAELLPHLASKPLTSTSLHSLIGFFRDRLADWKALRGALVGCLALLRRKVDVGIVTDNEVKAVAHCYFQYLQVQSLGQHDRKLSFQLMECLLDRYAAAMRDLGDDLVYGICEAIDGEKDPQCLSVVFRIVEGLGHLYPCHSGPLANYAEDLFEILGSYFPIHFTHPKDEDDEVKRGELSRALMLAFASTPLFEPFSVSLLLEKLSSSLLSAKVESFRYLSYCTPKYGPGRMAKYSQSLWASVKDAMYISPQSTLSLESESVSGMNFRGSDIMTQGLALLQAVIQQDSGFINLVTGDKDINVFVKSLNQYKGFDDIPLEVKQRLHAVSLVLSVCGKSSVALCNKVFESFFPLLMEGLGLSVANPSESTHREEDCFSLIRHNFGALYLCIELLATCRCLIVSLDDFTLISDFAHHTCCAMVSSFSESLVKAFTSTLRSKIANDAQKTYAYYGVKGLQILATFPGSSSLVSKSIYDNILLELVSVITSDIDKTFLWNWSLKALVEIGLSNENCSDSGKAASFKSVVLEKVVSLILSNDSDMPSSLKLQAAFDLGTTRKDFMLRVAKGFDEAISRNLSAVYDHGNLRSHELTTKLLDNYSHKVLPWLLDVGGFEEIPLNFALNIWDKIENCRPFSLSPPEIASDLLAATMSAMKKAVASCSEERQLIIVNKASGVLLSSNHFEGLRCEYDRATLEEEGSKNAHKITNSFSRDVWLTSLFASVVIALRPQTMIPNGKMILMLFISNLLNGHVPSAHALGSLINKLPVNIMKSDLSENLSLDEALDIIFCCCIGTNRSDRTNGNDGDEISISSLRLNTIRAQSANINTVIGLAWIGKGLLMRGHGKIKEIIMTLLSFLTLECNTTVCDEEDLHRLMKCSGDAFHIIMSESELCLSRTYHATIRPLYKQRFFSTIMPIFLSLIVKSELPSTRPMLYRAFAHVVIDTPLTAVLSDAMKLVPVLLDCLSMLSKDVLNKEIVYDVLLVLSGILMEKNGQEAIAENAPNIVKQLVELTTYPHVMAIRETALQCLVAMSGLPHTRIYPLRAKVLPAASKALDDPKRIVRQEAVKCRQAWASIASRTLHF